MRETPVLQTAGVIMLLRCSNCDFNHWEKNWMPFVHEGSLLAVRWFSPHTVVEVFPESGTVSQLHATDHGFAAGH